MREVDLQRIRALISQIQTACRQMNQLTESSVDEFLADFRNTESAKYLLLVATEAAIDICNHIVARQGARAPRGYADCFSALSELGCISAELAGRLRQTARFRNLLVHLYWEVDTRRVYRILKDDIKDLDVFIEQVLAYLKS